MCPSLRGPRSDCPLPHRLAEAVLGRYGADRRTGGFLAANPVRGTVADLVTGLVARLVGGHRPGDQHRPDLVAPPRGTFRREGEPAQRHGRTRNGHPTQRAGQQPAHGLYVVAVELHVIHRGNLVYRKPGGHPSGALIDLLDRRRFLVVLVGDLADNLLENVLDGHQAGGAAVLVDDDGHVDLLGLHLLERLNDVVGFCVPADERVGPGDRYIATELAALRTPVVAIVTKTDLASADQIGEQLLALFGLGDWAEVVPVSAIAGTQLDLLADLLVARLPASPPIYSDGELTDSPEVVMVAELIREAALAGVRDELPHSLAVVVDEMLPRPGRDLLDVHAIVYVERPSQKAIVLGAGGARMKTEGTVARHQIEALLGTPVYLDLHVKVAKDWQRDPKQLRRLGF